MIITKGAIYDYEEIVCFQEFCMEEFKPEVEKLLSKIEDEKQDFRIKYSDPRSGMDLLLFIRRGCRFRIMRTFILRGICLESDFSEEMEKDGSIEKWLGVEIEDDET